MVRYRRTDLENRTRAVVLVEQGQSYRAMGRQLRLNHKTVFSLVQKHRETGCLADKARGGQPRKTTVRQDRLLVRISLQNRRLTSTTMRAKMEEMHGNQLTTRTV